MTDETHRSGQADPHRSGDALLWERPAPEWPAGPPGRPERAPAPPSAASLLLEREGAEGGALLWRPRDLRPSPELAHVPFLLWLVEALRPRELVLLGLGDGVACHALCQASERLRLQAAITVHAEPGAAEALGPAYAREAARARALHRIRTGGPEAARARHEAPVDLLLALDPAAGGIDALGADWERRLSRRGAIVVIGTGGAPAAAGRDALRMEHGGGLAARLVGGGAPEALAALWADGARRARLAEVCAHLGAAWAASAEPRATSAGAGQPEAAALDALAERTTALGALRERLDALESDHRLACARRDELWGEMRGETKARAQAETALAGERRAREEAETALAGERQAREEAARHLTETAAELVAERQRLREAAEKAAASRARLKRKAEAERAAAQARERWARTRAALLGAELRARRSSRVGLRDWRASLGQPPRRRQIALIRASDLFDADWYASRHPDLATLAGRGGMRLGAGSQETRLAAHYLQFGAAEGRDPGPRFATRDYYLRHPEIAQEGWNALVHHHLLGPAGSPLRPRTRRGLQALRARLSDAALVAGSDHFDAEWYAARYRDIPRGMSPVRHYLTIGAAAGHDPGPRFSTGEYAVDHPDVAQAGINPLVHYLRSGEHEGRIVRPAGRLEASRRVEVLRAQLLTFGFTEAPLRELEAIARRDESRAARERAAVELGRWHLRRENGPDPERALGWLDLAAEAARGPASQGSQARIAVMRLACLGALGRAEAAERILAEARDGGYLAPPLVLASSMLAPDEAARIAAINEVMRGYGLPDLALREPEPGASLYDRLRSAGELAPVERGPMVSVIVAAYNAEATLPLTLTALREQTWRPHEVIVVDDASTDATRAVAERFAREDPRVRVLALDRNGGAYAARNRGLAEARGEFVALQDADDWAHATRLEAQARHLARHPDLVACTVQQARLRDDLSLAHFSTHGDLIFTCLASLMFRRRPVTARLGGWDEVRFSADHELIRRLHDAFTRSAVANLLSGPLIIQRYSEGSATADPATGFSGAYSGARLEYFEAQRHHRRGGGAPRYEPGTRPFPVPAIMTPEGRRGALTRCDVVIASDLRMHGGSVGSCVEEIRAQRAAGLRTGLVKMYRIDLPSGRPDTLSVVRDEIDGTDVRMLVYGERVACDLLIVRYPPVLRHPQRYLPQIEAGRVKVVVNQPPRSDYGRGGKLRYAIAEAEANLRRAFGKPGEWHPIGPLVREALHEHHAGELGAIDLRDDDWTNIIDLGDWDRGLGGGPRARPGATLRIGRHARDNPVKWPETAAEILEVYPEARDIEVHVLGGARAPVEKLGREPANWRVSPFGLQSPRAFLAGIDVFVYYTHSKWVESFGRAIVEAMAAGVPCVLPPHYEPVFGAAAVYAPPSAAVAAARRLHADPAAYRAQALAAQALVRERFGHDHHVARLRAAGVRGA